MKTTTIKTSTDGRTISTEHEVPETLGDFVQLFAEDEYGEGSPESSELVSMFNDQLQQHYPSVANRMFNLINGAYMVDLRNNNIKPLMKPNSDGSVLNEKQIQNHEKLQFRYIPRRTGQRGLSAAEKMKKAVTTLSDAEKAELLKMLQDN